MDTSKGTFQQVKCDSTKRASRRKPCGAYLGEFQTDKPNSAVHFCQRCSVGYRHTVDADGLITREVRDPKDRTIYTETVAMVVK